MADGKDGRDRRLRAGQVSRHGLRRGRDGERPGVGALAAEVRLGARDGRTVLERPDLDVPQRERSGSRLPEADENVAPRVRIAGGRSKERSEAKDGHPAGLERMPEDRLGHVHDHPCHLLGAEERLEPLRGGAAHARPRLSPPRRCRPDRARRQGPRGGARRRPPAPPARRTRRRTRAHPSANRRGGIDLLTDDDVIGRRVHPHARDARERPERGRRGPGLRRRLRRGEHVRRAE